MIGRIAPTLLLITVAIVVLFTNLGSARLWDRDEPRNAGCAEEMLQRNDWVTPIFNDELRDAKPVLLYWLIMSAYSVFGVTEFAARFWSAALALSTVLMTYGCASRLFSRTIGFWSALALSTSLMFVLAGRAATPDSVLIFCVTGSMTCYVYGTFRRKEVRSESARTNIEVGSVEKTPTESSLQFRDDVRRSLESSTAFPTRWPYLLCMYGFMGLGVLAKGPVGFVLPMAIIGMFMLIARLERRTSPVIPIGSTLSKRFLCAILEALRTFAPRHFLRTFWAMRPITAVMVISLVAAPWFVWVGMKTDGDFLQGFFLKEHFGRATTSFENHSGPIYFYLVAILVGFFPWSVFAVPTVLSHVSNFIRKPRGSEGDPNRLASIESDSHDKQSDEGITIDRLATVFCLCWVGIFVGVFTIAQTKLPSYITPCYPALAMLCGNMIGRSIGRDQTHLRRWTQTAFVIFALIGVCFLIGVPIAADQLMPGIKGLALIGLGPLIGGTVACWAMMRQRFQVARCAFAVGAICFVLGLFGFGTVLIDRQQKVNELLSLIDQHPIEEQAIVASFGVLESSWVFYAKQPIYELSPDENAYADFSREKSWKPKPRPNIESFLEQEGEPYIITTESAYPELQSRLPDGFQVLHEVPYFMQDETLFLIGKPNAEASSGSQLADRPDNSVQR